MHASAAAEAERVQRAQPSSPPHARSARAVRPQSTPHSDGAREALSPKRGSLESHTTTAAAPAAPATAVDSVRSSRDDHASSVSAAAAAAAADDDDVGHVEQYRVRLLEIGLFVAVVRDWLAVGAELFAVLTLLYASGDALSALSTRPRVDADTLVASDWLTRLPALAATMTPALRLLTVALVMVFSATLATLGVLAVRRSALQYAAGDAAAARRMERVRVLFTLWRAAHMLIEAVVLTLPPEGIVVPAAMLACVCAIAVPRGRPRERLGTLFFVFAVFCVAEQLACVRMPRPPVGGWVGGYLRNRGPISFVVVAGLFGWLLSLIEDLLVRNDTLVQQRRALIVEREDAEQLAVAAAESSAHMIASISFGLRQPVDSMMASTERLLGLRLDAEQRKLCSLISSSCAGLHEIVSDVLDLSHVADAHVHAGTNLLGGDSGAMHGAASGAAGGGTGAYGAQGGLPMSGAGAGTGTGTGTGAGHAPHDDTIRIDARKFSVRDTVEAALDVTSMLAYGKHVHLVAVVGTDVPPLLLGDPHRLRQVLVNIVGNAVKFTQAGEIELRVVLNKATDTEVELLFSCRDTGLGIPPDRLVDIFGVFTQAQLSTARRFGGSGLGLSICKRIVEAMGGRIWAESGLRTPSGDASAPRDTGDAGAASPASAAAPAYAAETGAGAATVPIAVTPALADVSTATAPSSSGAQSAHGGPGSTFFFTVRLERIPGLLRMQLPSGPLHPRLVVGVLASNARVRAALCDLVHQVGAQPVPWDSTRSACSALMALSSITAPSATQRSRLQSRARVRCVLIDALLGLERGRDLAGANMLGVGSATASGSVTSAALASSVSGSNASVRVLPVLSDVDMAPGAGPPAARAMATTSSSSPPSVSSLPLQPSASLQQSPQQQQQQQQPQQQSVPHSTPPVHSSAGHHGQPAHAPHSSTTESSSSHGGDAALMISDTLVSTTSGTATASATFPHTAAGTGPHSPRGPQVVAEGGALLSHVLAAHLLGRGAVAASSAAAARGASGGTGGVGGGASSPPAGELGAVATTSSASMAGAPSASAATDKGRTGPQTMAIAAQEALCALPADVRPVVMLYASHKHRPSNWRGRFAAVVTAPAKLSELARQLTRTHAALFGVTANADASAQQTQQQQQPQQQPPQQHQHQQQQQSQQQQQQAQLGRGFAQPLPLQQLQRLGAPSARQAARVLPLAPAPAAPRSAGASGGVGGAVAQLATAQASAFRDSATDARSWLSRSDARRPAPVLASSAASGAGAAASAALSADAFPPAGAREMLQGLSAGRAAYHSVSVMPASPQPEGVGPARPPYAPLHAHGASSAIAGSPSSLSPASSARASPAAGGAHESPTLALPGVAGRPRATRVLSVESGLPSDRRAALGQRHASGASSGDAAPGAVAAGRRWRDRERSRSHDQGEPTLVVGRAVVSGDDLAALGDASSEDSDGSDGAYGGARARHRAGGAGAAAGAQLGVRGLPSPSQRAVSTQLAAEPTSLDSFAWERVRGHARSSGGGGGGGGGMASSAGLSGAAMSAVRGTGLGQERSGEHEREFGYSAPTPVARSSGGAHADEALADSARAAFRAGSLEALAGYRLRHGDRVHVGALQQPAAAAAAAVAAPPALPLPHDDVGSGTSEDRSRRPSVTADNSLTRVLVVDDAPANRVVLQMYLDKLGYDCAVATNGLEAVEAVQGALEQGAPFDAILLDIEMPVLTGVEAAPRIRALDPHVRIIALTGHEDFQGWRSAGMDASCTKPIRLTQLRSILERFVVHRV